VSQTRRTLSGVLVIAGLLVVVSMSAVFMGFVAFSPETDRSNRLLALFIMTPLLVASFAFVVALYRAVFAKQISRRRWARAGRHLAASGFRDATPSEIQDTLGLPVQLLAPYTLALQRGGGIDHVMVGSVGDQQVRCFNVRIRGGGWMDVPAVALRLDAAFASTLIRPQRVPIRPRPDMKRAWFEHERFNRSLAVFSVDPFFANALVDPRMMDWLRTNLHRTTIELAGRWVLAWNMPRGRFRRGPLELMDVVSGFAERVPRAVPSLFPRRSDTLRWRH